MKDPFAFVARALPPSGSTCRAQVATAAFERAFATGAPVPYDVTWRTGGEICRLLASVTFGGADLRTVHLGSLRSSNIPTFRSPVAGLPMVHW